MTERILITGGSGFIGTNLVHLCRTRRSDVVVNLDWRAPQSKEHADAWVKGRLLDRQALVQLFADFRPTQVFHLAARTDLQGASLSDYLDNVEGVRNVVAAVNATESVRRAVFASSRMVCDLGYRPASDTDYRPPNAYGESKVIGEQIVRSDGRPGVWTLVRPTSIWGPWFDVPYRDFFDSVRRGYFVSVRGHSGVAKSFGYVGNTVHQLVALMSASAAEVAGRTFYLADYSPTPVNQMAECVRVALGAPRIRTVPYSALRVAAVIGDLAKRLGWREPPLTTFRLRNLLTDMVFDLSPLEAVVGPLPYSMAEGVTETVRWMRRDTVLCA